MPRDLMFIFFFFNDTATTEIYTLSLHDALPIFGEPVGKTQIDFLAIRRKFTLLMQGETYERRSEEHTSELQSHLNLVCRLLLEKKKKSNKRRSYTMCIVLYSTTCFEQYAVDLHG